MSGAKVAFDPKHEKSQEARFENQNHCQMDSAVVQSSCSCGLYRTHGNWSLIFSYASSSTLHPRQ